MKKKIFVFLGHPDNDSLNCTLADEYQRGAEAAGHEVRRMNLGEMQFDPVLHHGYRVVQPLEADLVAWQNNIRWADHFVIFYPSWWSTMPARLKGVFDRAWMPGFAFHFTSEFSWKKLMKGKTASMFVTSDTMPLIQRILFGDTTNELKRGILGFAGFSVRVRKYGYLKHFKVNRRQRLQQKVFRLGQAAK